ncbi:MAG: helix-turn-helix domain-containing protein [Lachnospiraceae bacterium]
MHESSKSSKANLNSNIASRIHSVRAAMGLTQSEFAERCDLSTNYIAAIETGCKGIGVQTLYKICNATNMSADYFLFGEEKVPCSYLNSTIENLDSSLQPHVVNIINELFAISAKNS